MASTEKFVGDEWRGRVGGSWAAEWVRTDRSFGRLTGWLVEALKAALPADEAGQQLRVLDIGCGAGETALRLARERPDLHVTGLDLSDDLIGVAKLRGAALDNLSFQSGDAGSWHGESDLDAALSRHGVMFFDDPAGALCHLRSLMRPGAPFIFTCFAARAENFWASELAELIGASPPADLYAPGPFAFADPHHVLGILVAAGWKSAVPERVDYGYVPGGGDDPVADALDFFRRIGPAARHMALLDPAARLALEPRLEAWLAAHVEEGEVRFPAVAWLWRATA